MPASAETVEAQWKVHQVRFRFVGFSTAYTCDSIEYTLSRLLKILGARDDVRAEASCTSGRNPNRVQRVKLAFALPVLANDTDVSAEVFPARWEEVKVVGHSSRYLDSGDCELLEQFEREVMPKLQVKNTGRKIRCVPYRSELNRIRLKVSALKILEKKELETNREQ
ncbi:MAG: hypothetical protein GKR93_14810 [Gammaproteobacteria bacterium]|nr:hypothetical protein [Gammaproteobacteria bacterium]